MKFLKLTIVLVFVFLSSNIFGQIKIHKHITTEDGLVHNKILSMYQDSKGFLWFGTMGGVSKWDGNNFTNFTKSNGLPSAAVLAIIESPNGSILFSTYRKGFIELNNGRIDTVNKQNGLNSNMVNGFRIIDGKLIVISNIAQEYRNGKFLELKINLEKLKGPLGDLIIENNINTYASSRTKGFYVKDKTINKFFTVKDGLLSNEILRIKKDNNGYILIATSKGINKYKDGKITLLKANGKIINAFVTDILPNKNGINYYASNKGLIVEKNNSVEILTTENGLLDNNVDQLLEDQNGTIYLGYEHSGISIYNPDRFTNFISKNNSTEFIANSIIQNSDSRILLGTQEGITIISDNGIQKVYKRNGLFLESVFSLAQNKNNDILIGTTNSFNILRKNKIIPYYMDKSSHREIYDIVISPDGDIIMAERREGLKIFTPINQSNKSFLNNLLSTGNANLKSKITKKNNLDFGERKVKPKKINDGTLNTINLLNGLQNTWILDLLMSSDSTLVIGYHGRGASFYKNGKFKHLKKADGLTDGIVTTLFEHTDGTYWLGTREGGITIYNDEVIDTIDILDGLSSNDIRGIVQLNDNIYVTTSKGLDIIIKYSNEYFIRQIKNIDGLASNNCKPNSILLDNKNKIWIGTSKGVSKYNPNADKVITTPPKLYFSGIEIFNEEYSLDKFLKEKELQYNENYIKIKYTGINLSSPKEIIFKHRLSGVDKGWIEGSENFANYTSLDNGEYTFEVKARNEWGYWSKPNKLLFLINPAWWQTWWFYLLILLSIVALISFLVSYRYRNLLAVEKIRTKISTDLHDSIGSGLTEITFLSQILNNRIKQDEIAQNQVTNITSISKNLITEMRDIVWLVNPKKDSLKDLFYRLKDAYQDLTQHSKINFRINNIENLANVRLPMSFRQHIYLIFKEAINNSIKYSKCKNVIVDIQTKSNILKVVLTDDGIGFDINTVKKGNGINNMLERTDIINGKIEFISHPGKGTTIIFTGVFKKLKSIKNNRAYS